MKNILLFSTGLSPQVVTESLYYHTQLSKIKIDSIYIITDSTGAKLLDDLFKWYNKFLNEYEINYKINFTWNNIFILKDKRNNPLKDLKTIDDNDAAVTQIFDIINDLSNIENSRLIVSVAGGRKSMSVIVGQGLQFFGKKHDTLTHVIVDDDIVGCPNFYYPTKDSNIIKFKNRSIDTKKIKIYLDEIPFIRLRNILGTINPSSKSSLNSLVKTAQKQIESKSQDIQIQIKNNEIVINNKKIKMPAKVKSIYLLILGYFKGNYKNLISKNDYISPDNILSKSFLNEYYQIYSSLYKSTNSFVVQELERIEDNKKREYFFTLSWLQETRSKINRLLKDQLNPYEFALCHIQSSGKRFEIKYRIPIHKNKINFL